MGDVNESPLLSGNWNCDVCHRSRPNDMIATAEHAHTDGNGITVYQNVKYCTDSETCSKIAHLRSLTDLAARQIAEDRQEAVEKLWDSEAAKWRWVTTMALVGFWLGFLIRGAIG